MFEQLESVGVDFGETFAGGFVCKDLSSYEVDKKKNHYTTRKLVEL
jgi:hypothetical protein